MDIVSRYLYSTDNKIDRINLFKITGEYATFKAIVNNIWDQYDEDASNTLSREEVKKFLLEHVYKLPRFNGTTFDDDSFDELFANYDHDGTGEISKREMAEFIK